MTRDDAVEIYCTARSRGDHPSLRGADLREVDLREVGLSGADLSGANLSRAVLRGPETTPNNCPLGRFFWGRSASQPPAATT